MNFLTLFCVNPILIFILCFISLFLIFCFQIHFLRHFYRTVLSSPFLDWLCMTLHSSCSCSVFILNDFPIQKCLPSHHSIHILIHMFFSYSHLPSYMFLFEQLSKNTPSFSLVFYLFSVRVLFLFYRLTPSIPLPLILFLSSFSWWCQFHRISPLFHRFISSFIFSHTTQT